MRHWIVLLVMIICGTMTAQETELTREEQYAFNIQQEYLNDVYIPADIDDAMKQIDLLSDEAGRAKFLETDEQTAADRLVRGLGVWMAVKWNFDEGSRLSHFLKEMGVSHPDDMAHFLIVSYHRYLHGTKQEYQTRAKVYYDQRFEDQQKRNRRKVIRKG